MTRLYMEVHIGVSVMSLKSQGGIWRVCPGWVEARAECTRRVFFFFYGGDGLTLTLAPCGLGWERIAARHKQLH